MLALQFPGLPFPLYSFLCGSLSSTFPTVLPLTSYLRQSPGPAAWSPLCRCGYQPRTPAWCWRPGCATPHRRFRHFPESPGYGWTHRSSSPTVWPCHRPSWWWQSSCWTGGTSRRSGACEDLKTQRYLYLVGRGKEKSFFPWLKTFTFRLKFPVNVCGSVRS